MARYNQGKRSMQDEWLRKLLEKYTERQEECLKEN